jgi:hypothetical protein
MHVTGHFVEEGSKHSRYSFWGLTARILPGLIFLVVLVLYILPNTPEALLIHLRAPSLALVIHGDIAGCTVIAALLNIRWALGIYAMASGIELALVRFGGIGPRTLMWITDLVPTAIVSALIVFAAWRGRTWRMHKSSSPRHLETDRWE